MLPHSSINYTKFFRLQLVIGAVSIGVLLIWTKFSFLFEAEYESFRIWYPNYYFFAYTTIQIIKYGVWLFLIYLVYKLKFYFFIKKWLKQWGGYTKSVVNSSPSEIQSKNVNLAHNYYFWIGQVALLIITFLSYYILQKEYTNYQLLASRIYILSVLYFCMIYFVINANYFIPVVIKFLFAASKPYNLAIYRMFFFFHFSKTVSGPCF